MDEGSVELKHSERLRRIGWIAWAGGWVVLVALALYPVASRSLLGGFLLLIVFQWALSLFLAWPKKRVRYAMAAPVAFLVLVLLLPGRTVDSGTLANQYVRSVERYEGTPYVWGGEKELGVDCSGLPRRALERVCVAQGLVTANGALLRQAMDLWLHDASARAMGEEYRGMTRHLFDAESVNDADHSRLQPGDLAVTQNGIHVLVYLGDRTWMEASPTEGRVVRRQIPSQTGYFQMPVRLMRWTILELPST